MRFSRLVVVCGFAACLLPAVFAQQPKPADPPPAKDPNAVPGTFRAYIVLDQRTPLPKDPKEPQDPKAPKEPTAGTEGKRNVTGFQHDLIVANELNPTVAVFARTPAAKADEPVAVFVGRLKELAAAYKSLDFGTYLFFPVLDKPYTDDPKAAATGEALRKWAEGVAVGPVVVGLCEKASDQTKAWKLPDDQGVTVVFYHRLKVVKRWDLPAGGLSAEVMDAVAAEVNKELGKK
jgi:hypothetical protein